MRVLFRFCFLVCAMGVALASTVVLAEGSLQPDGPHRVALPLIATPPNQNNPFGFDVSPSSTDDVLQYASVSRPRWSRAGTIFWAGIEATPGQYNLAGLSMIESHVRWLRQAGIEPTLVVQRTPSWAQSIPGRLCSPPKPEYLDDFARFMMAMAQHFSRGDLAVHYWEIWNEPDVAPDDVDDTQGMGCWRNPSAPYQGGDYYGAALKQVYPAIKAANPNARVMAGALLYNWPDDSGSRAFLEGMLASGAGSAFDVLTYHAYGEWGAGDLLVNKAVRIRAVLAKYGLADKPLIATEVAAICLSDDPASCPPNYDTWIQRQANYAARIYAEAIALKLQGAFWYTLSDVNPGFRYSHLIDNQNGTLVPRPAYHAFTNSARLLDGAEYVGPPLQEMPPDQVATVQALKFRKARSTYENRPSTLYVVWISQIGSPGVTYPVFVNPGASAICTTKLSGAIDDPDPNKRMRVFSCSDTNNDGVIWFNVIDFPQYIEVLE